MMICTCASCSIGRLRSTIRPSTFATSAALASLGPIRSATSRGVAPRGISSSLPSGRVIRIRSAVVFIASVPSCPRRPAPSFYGKAGASQARKTNGPSIFERPCGHPLTANVASPVGRTRTAPRPGGGRRRIRGGSPVRHRLLVRRSPICKYTREFGAGSTVATSKKEREPKPPLPGPTVRQISTCRPCRRASTATSPPPASPHDALRGESRLAMEPRLSAVRVTLVWSMTPPSTRSSYVSVWAL